MPTFRISAGLILMGMIIGAMTVGSYVVSNPPTKFMISKDGMWENIQDHIPPNVNTIYLSVTVPNSEGKMVPAKFGQLIDNHAGGLVLELK